MNLSAPLRQLTPDPDATAALGPPKPVAVVPEAPPAPASPPPLSPPPPPAPTRAQSRFQRATQPDPPTPPQPRAVAPPLPLPPPAPARPTTAPGKRLSGFTARRYQFTAGVGASERGRIIDPDGTPLFHYRGFASVIGIVAGLVAAIVMAAGIAAALFLFIEKSMLTSSGALMLSFLFAMVVVQLIPAAHVTLVSGERAVLKIVPQRGGFASTRWLISTGDGQVIGTLKKGVFARFGRSRWKIGNADGKTIGRAADESLFRAYLRKVAGKFDRRFEADVLVFIGKTEAATIFRRPDEHDAVDVLQIHDLNLDPRIAIALATLVLGSEP